MSHIVHIRTQIRDVTAVAAACSRLGLSAPSHQTVRLFNTTATGLAVQLPGWRYPVVCDLASGQLAYDNYNGHWGKQQELDRFLQGYACERAKLEARQKGYTVTEQPLSRSKPRALPVLLARMPVVLWKKHLVREAANASPLNFTSSTQLPSRTPNLNEPDQAL